MDMWSPGRIGVGMILESEKAEAAINGWLLRRVGSILRAGSADRS